MKHRYVCTAVLIASLGTLWIQKLVQAQDPVKVAPDTYKAIFENDRVRVLDIRVKPSGKSPTHSHPALVIYPLNDSKIKFTHPDGKTAVAELKAGQVIWSDAVTHAAENVGDTEAHALNIELKQPAKPGEHSTGVPAEKDPAKIAPNNYKVLLDNSRVRVCEVRAKPGDKIDMHSHPDHVVYFVRGSKVKFSHPDGKSVEKDAKTGDVMWSSPVAHSTENVGDAALHVLVVELK